MCRLLPSQQGNIIIRNVNETLAPLINFPRRWREWQWKIGNNPNSFNAKITCLISRERTPVTWFFLDSLSLVAPISAPPSKEILINTWNYSHAAAERLIFPISVLLARRWSTEKELFRDQQDDYDRGERRWCCLYIRFLFLFGNCSSFLTPSSRQSISINI